ncbi:MAG: ABC transporter ATP-binding protein, partial [Acidimicrobiales bacterium]|nr:ABC transporter ATP-binding protein [Acidimicrobiales bacterium]
MGMWMSGGVDEHDKLDRLATGRVLRRTAAWIRPYRRQATGAFALLFVFSLSNLAGPLLVRRAIDK